MVLQCVATIQKEHRKFCLAVEGLGNRVCYLEPTSEAKVRMARSFVLCCRYCEEMGRKWQFGVKQAAIAAAKYINDLYAGAALWRRLLLKILWLKTSSKHNLLS